MTQSDHSGSIHEALDWIERDRREPDKVLCALLTARRRASDVTGALAELVRLKDGARDDAYRAAKDAAWQAARAALGQEHPSR